MNGLRYVIMSDTAPLSLFIMERNPFNPKGSFGTSVSVIQSLPEAGPRWPIGHGNWLAYSPRTAGYARSLTLRK